MISKDQAKGLDDSEKSELFLIVGVGSSGGDY